ncbi:MAG: hypothetical protein ACRCUT_04445 [Spirochaetota bacterium]
MFRKKSSGRAQRFAGERAVPIKPRRKLERRRIFKILISMLAAALIADFVCALRSCGCSSSSSQQTAPHDEAVSVKKNISKKTAAVNSARSAAPGNSAVPENKDAPPEKPEPKILDLGTHIEIVTPD